MSFLKFATKLAKKVGKHQLASLSNKHEIEYKGEINIVTEVDKACEKMIVEAIQKNYPDHGILGEEGTSTPSQSGYRWVVDPLDGTTNYAHSYPLFCVSLGLEYQGEVILGVIYDPNRDELFHSEKNKGSFLNGKKIKVSSISELKKSLLVTGFAYNILETQDNNIDHFKNMLFNVQAVRRDGVAAIDLCYVACGRYEGFWELNLYPWDVAAGSLILTEAGGQVSLFDGSQFAIDKMEILASNGLVHNEMKKVLKLKT